jgi:hypothetical protein
MHYRQAGPGNNLMQTINPALFDKTFILNKGGALKPPHHLLAID